MPIFFFFCLEIEGEESAFEFEFHKDEQSNH